MGQQSEKLYALACKLIPGGVNSPVRAFKAVDGKPLFIQHAQNARLVDVDNVSYLDFVMSWGPLILGHAHPYVVDAVKKALAKGTSYGAPTSGEVEMAEVLTEALPSLEMVRLVNSGTEAVMSALRLARAYTQREKIIKFDCCYHGHADSMLVKGGSGLLTLGIPQSPGVPSDVVKDTVVLPYNDQEAVQQAFDRFGKDIAAVILEPICGNSGCILPKEGYLSFLREITRQHQALLIFDEVITGFRVGYGGAQGLYGIQPDLTTLGKIIGGGFPVGAYGGKREIMAMVAPEGPVYQAGTLSGNPIAIAAGLATLKVLKNAQTYEQLEEKGRLLEEGLKESAKNYGIPLQVNRQGSMLSLFFSEKPVWNLQDALSSKRKYFSHFHKAMLQEGIYLPPSPFECWFISLAHATRDIEETLQSADKSFKTLARTFELGPYR